MENIQQPSDTGQQVEEKQLTFDEYVGQLPASKQSTHRWMRWLIAATFILTLGVFIYAIYASFKVKSFGEANVVLAWMFFFLASAIAVFLLGLDTLILGATIPLPSKGAQYSFESGHKAVRQGWGLIGYGVIVILLVIIGVAAVRAGSFDLEDWITLIVGFFVILGLGSAALAILRRVLR